MPSSLFDTPLGPIAVHWQGETLTGIDLEPLGLAGPDSSSLASLPGWIARQLEAYFTCSETRFDFPLALAGTPYQRRVWSALQAIPVGETRTYGDLAHELGSAARAVGQACRSNPCPIVVPCHRVVAKQGLGGFAGDTSGRRLEVKRWLLRHEGVAHV
ncbi:methylated-DNA--[protein]-cysteine S-methyltransferase [Thiorhodococcus fuscus]|uniref:Methylated-DNA--[protein]-cysteine S-methyltransferase n=1 Tax=Thiorhodococcus fuscus TaxID=527200 RepID=A0ABW4Y456_9GAMM